jgi:predicted SprT family Zn-dependent metalloprotease
MSPEPLELSVLSEEPVQSQREEMLGMFTKLIDMMTEEKKLQKEKALYSFYHHGYTCDECKISPIKGIRYKSSTKNDYDLCEDCEAKSIDEDIYLKIKTPAIYAKHNPV